MSLAWLLLICAGLFEVGFAVLLKASLGFTRLWPTLGFIVFAALSFGFLARAVTTLPIGTAYVVWVGIGALGTVLVGILFYGDAVTPARLFFIGLLLVSLVGLKLVSD